MCVCLFNVRAEHVIKSRVLKAPRRAKDAGGGGKPLALKLEANCDMREVGYTRVMCTDMIPLAPAIYMHLAYSS